MPLDRNTVQRRIRQHIRHLKDAGAHVTAGRAREIEKLHRQMARKVEDHAESRT